MSENPEESKKENGIIDPQLQEELENEFPEDPILTEYAMRNNSEDNEKVNVTSDWIGDNEGENWKPKTKVSAEQIIAMTQARMLPNVFDELSDIEHLIDEMVKDLEQYAVSHEGMAREQQVSVLRAMHSGEHHEDTEKRSALLNALAMPTKEED